jgi:redox-sensitive bicupin YhaK (pirin superfamily)
MESRFDDNCRNNLLIMKTRTIDKITTSPLRPGFLGQGHMAAAVVDGQHFAESDPFIMLMDDQLDLPGGEPVGGAHPHAGFETVTLVLEGDDRDWKTGSLELMTAGKGIVHTEEITAETRMRILQLWLVLPPAQRWAEPFHQRILLEGVPTLKTAQSEIRVYSGTSNGLTSPLKNQTPFTLVDFQLKENTTATQQLPANYNGFIYVIDGVVQIGGTPVEQGQTGWFDKPGTAGDSEIVFQTAEQGARFVLYAGQPHHVPVVSYGPFIGDSQADIRRLYSEYREGRMPHLNDLPSSRKILHSA